MDFLEFVRSDHLPALRAYLGPLLDKLGGLIEVRQVRLVVDTNAEPPEPPRARTRRRR